jgi:ubiquinone/menaquinone biosynthesis C-methylase UbiE
MFLRKTRLAREPLAVTMSGVRLGERALQIGGGDTRCVALIAAKSGLTGTAAIVVPDEGIAVRIRRAVADVGALVDLRVVSEGMLPFDDAAFDAIVVHDTSHTILDSGTRGRWLHECRRLLRSGGRIVTIEPGAQVGLRALFSGGSQSAAMAAGGDTITTLRSAGFAAVRVLGDREGLRFIEGRKTV